MDGNSWEDVILPQTVEDLISRICREQNQRPLANSTRQALADIGEEESLRILVIIQGSTIRTTFDRYVMYMIKKEVNNNGSPRKRPSSSSQLDCSPLSSPVKTSRLMMNSQQVSLRGEDAIQTAITPPLSYSPALVALGELEFRKAFLILSYIGSKRLEEATTAYKIRSLKDLPMDKFEEEVWVSLGIHYTPAADRCKSLEWESGKTYEYCCHVSEDGSFRFKGPCMDKSRSHLQRVLGDDNVLNVKFADVTDGRSSAGNDCFAEYKKIFERGILVVLRRYRFFVFNMEAKKQERKT